MSDFHDLVIYAHIFQKTPLYPSQPPFSSHQVGKICPKEIYWFQPVLSDLQHFVKKKN
jgi:hypothetical protein